MRIGLRIVASTKRGAGDGSVRLAELLKRYDATATFYFNLGPARLHRWLPARDVAWRATAGMREVHAAGFEVGVYGWDPARWCHHVARGDYAWTEQAMRQAREMFEHVFGESPRTHAAPDWQMNRHAFRLTQRLGYDYASDTRGRTPFVPVCEAELVACPQLPTTLPTISELLQQGKYRVKNVHDRVLDLTAELGLTNHVFTVQAERRRRAARVLEVLIKGWRDLGYDIVSLRKVMESLEPMATPHHVVVTDEIPGRPGSVAMEGAPFLTT
jgi:undecaprenyl phosphate-alpha-L-ara4FN deformylase